MRLKDGSRLVPFNAKRLEDVDAHGGDEFLDLRFCLCVRHCGSPSILIHFAIPCTRSVCRFHSTIGCCLKFEAARLALDPFAVCRFHAKELQLGQEALPKILHSIRLPFAVSTKVAAAEKGAGPIRSALDPFAVCRFHESPRLKDTPESPPCTRSVCRLPFPRSTEKAHRMSAPACTRSVCRLPFPRAAPRPQRLRAVRHRFASASY